MTARAVVIAISLAWLGSVAHADRADQLFKKGKRLLGEKRYAEACTAFQDSDKIDPGIGAKLNVARCYEEWGKLATASRWYHDAQQMAKDTKDDRAKKIQSLIDDLDPNIPRLKVSVPGASAAITAQMEITLDGTPVDPSTIGLDQRVDPGPHQISYVVDGKKQEKLVPVERRGAAEVTLDAPSKRRKGRAGSSAGSTGAGSGDDDEEDEPRSRRSAGRTQKLFGLGVAGAGVVGLGVAGIVTLRARTDYHHALDAHCRGVTNMCDATGQKAADSAHHRANIATVVTIGGAAAIAGGVVIYLIAPSRASRSEHAMYVAPAVDGSTTGLVLGGAF